MVGKTYERYKKLISFRSNISTRELTEEQKREVAERMKNLRRRSIKNEKYAVRKILK